MLKCITLDITNTLIKVSGDVGCIYSQIAKKFGYEGLNQELATLTFKKKFKKLNEIYPGYGFSMGMSSKEWWGMVVEAVLLEDCAFRNVKIQKKQIIHISDKIFDEFKKETYWKKFDNCDILLENLKRKGFMIGVVSNFDERIFPIIKNLNIENYFDFVLIPSNSNGSYKPQKEIFLQALIRSNIKDPKNKILHVGDSLELDYIAAKSCQFDSILINHGKKIQNFNNINEDDYATDLYDLENKIKTRF